MRRILPVAAALGAVLLLSGCASGPERASIGVADRTVAGIADEMTPAGRIFDVSGAYLVSEYVHDPEVVAMSWRGSSGDQAGDGARVVLRVHVAKSFTPSTTIFGSDSETADLTRCYRIEVRTWRYSDTSRVSGTDCPTTPVPPQPTGLRPEELPADAAARLAGVLQRAVDADDAARLAKAAFPSYVTVDARDWRGGIVVAVGAPAVRDCTVAQRLPGGKVEPVYFRSIWAQPGELGCTTQLLTNPPQ